MDAKLEMEEFGNREEIRLLVDDDDGLASSCSPASALCLCRICHEEEEERNTSMESPCGCSGTLKVSIAFTSVSRAKKVLYLAVLICLFPCSSLLTGNASRDGATRRGATFARFASR